MSLHLFRLRRRGLCSSYNESVKCICAGIDKDARYTSLRANLQHCADLGQKAFLEAEARMTKLYHVASIINSDGGAVSARP